MFGFSLCGRAEPVEIAFFEIAIDFGMQLTSQLPQANHSHHETW
jgi:hypothetical protein